MEPARRTGLRTLSVLGVVVALLAASFGGIGAPGGAQAAAPRWDLFGVSGNAFPWEDHWDAFQPLLDNSGAGWARVELRWNQVEPAPNSFDWGGTDTLVNAYAQHGFQLLGLLGYSVAWANGGSGNATVFGPPTDLNAWDGYVRAIVSRYQDRIHAWEIWNEPDTAMFWNGQDGGDPAAYLTLLQHAYQDIKSIDPSATVMNGGVTGTARGAQFLNTLLDLGGGASLDAIAIHGYLPNDGVTDDTFRSEVWPLLSQVQQRSGKPLWVTEFGWSSGSGDAAAAGSESAQATYLARELPLLFTLGGVARVSLFQFKDPNDQPNTFGITRPDGTPKPAYVAISTMAQQLAGLSYERTMDLGIPGVTDVRFSSPARTVDVVWSLSGDHQINYPSARAAATIWHIDGSQATSAQDGDGIPVVIGGDPILVARDGQAVPPGSPAGCQAFPQTGQAACDGFLEYWQQHGNVAILGLPISPELTEGGRTVQYFERAKLEYHPEWAGSPWMVVGELVGRSVTAGRQNEPPFQPLPATTGSDANCTFYAATGHRLCFGFRAFWQDNGGLQVFGYPISEEFQEKNPDTGQVYTVQYFERARFEYHPEFAGTPYAVQLGRLGAELYSARY